MKVCKKCFAKKPLEEFQKDNRCSDGRTGKCKRCIYAENKERVANNPELKERIRGQRKQTKERRKDKNREWNKEYCKRPDVVARRRQRDRENWKKADKAKKNAQRNARRRERYKNDPDYREKLRTDANARNYRSRGAWGKFDRKEWREVCKKYDYRCLWCGEKKPLSVDHIVSVTNNGSNQTVNLQPLCKTCNAKKHKKTIDFRPFWDTNKKLSPENVVQKIKILFG